MSSVEITPEKVVPIQAEQNTTHVAAEVNDSSQASLAQSSFPVLDLEKLEKKLAIPQWVVPIKQDGHLDVCMKAALQLRRQNPPVEDVACSRFINGALVTSFDKLLNSTAVYGWDDEVHVSIVIN